MNEESVLTTLIGDQPRVKFFFGDSTECGITDPFYDSALRNELYNELYGEGPDTDSFEGLGLDAEQEKALAPGMRPFVLLRTTRFFAERDFSAMSLAMAEKEILRAQPEWEEVHAFFYEEALDKMFAYFSKKLRRRIGAAESVSRGTINGGVEAYYPAYRGDRFVYVFFALEPIASTEESDMV